MESLGPTLTFDTRLMAVLVEFLDTRNIDLQEFSTISLCNINDIQRLHVELDLL